MGPPPRTSDSLPIFQYDESQDFYFCQKCATHISSLAHLRQKFSDPENKKHYLLFDDLLNVVPDADYVLSNDKTTVGSAYCTNCSADFGFKLIKLETPKDEIQEGRFIVFANKFQIWKGKKVLDAVTEDPAKKILDVVINDPDSVQFPVGPNEVPVGDESVADLAKELHEKTMEMLRITEQLKLLMSGNAFHVEKTLLDDGVTKDPFMPDAAPGGSR